MCFIKIDSMLHTSVCSERTQVRPIGLYAPFDVISDLLPNRRTAILNLFVKQKNAFRSLTEIFYHESVRLILTI